MINTSSELQVSITRTYPPSTQQAASGALQTCPDELLGPCLALMQPVLCACAATDPALPLALCKAVAGHRRLTAAGATAFYALLAALAPSLPPAPLLALLVPLLGGPAAPISLLDRVECSLAELRRACCPVKDAEACLPALNALRRAAAARQADAPALSAREGTVLARALLVLPLVVYRAAEAGASPPPPERRHAAAAACGVAVRLLSSGQCSGLEEILVDLDIAVSALCGWGGLARLSEDADADPDTLGWAGPRLPCRLEGQPRWSPCSEVGEYAFVPWSRDYYSWSYCVLHTASPTPSNPTSLPDIAVQA